MSDVFSKCFRYICLLTIMWVSDEKHGVFQTIQRAYILILNSIGWTESSSSGCRILPQSVCDFIYKSQLFKPSKQSEQELYIERTLLGAVFLSMSMIVLFLLYKCVRKCQKVQQGHNRRFRLSSGEHASSQSSSKSLSLSAVRTAPSGEICWRPCSSSPYQVCWRWVGVACLFAFLASLPWEFVRIYQQEVAKKAAVSLKVCIIIQMFSSLSESPTTLTVDKHSILLTHF